MATSQATLGTRVGASADGPSFQQRMSSAGTMPKPMSTIVDKVAGISTLPRIALKIVELAKDQDATLRDMANVIQADPALTARVLRLVNSAAFALSKKLTSLDEAVNYLGMKGVRNMALTASVSRIFKQGESFGPYQRVNLWRHMVTVALCARLVAKKSGVSDAEEAFLAGLLHDIGIILEDQYDHRDFRKMILALRAGDSLCRAEQVCLGYDHTQLGEQIAAQWNFPETIRNCILFHHNAVSYAGEDADIVCCIEVADALCTARGISPIGLKLAKPKIEVFQRLQLEKGQVKGLMQKVDEEIMRHQELFDCV